MKIRVLLVALYLLLFLPSSLYSQPPSTLWTETFGGSNLDVGHSVKQTSDGGFVITGYTRSYGAATGRNVWLIKTDELGNELWNNTFGGDDDDEGYSVYQTNDNGYIISGYTLSSGAGLNDVYLIKTDANGNLEWEKTFGGAQDDEGYSVQQTVDGGFIIGGVTSSFGTGSRDVWLIKTDSNGNEVWSNTFGGFSSDGAWAVRQTADNGYILTGWTLSEGPGFLGNVYLVKTDSLGNQEWTNYFGGSDVDRGYDVQQTNDGGYIITGYTDSFGAGLYDMSLIKTDASGNEIWTKTFGGSGRDYGNSVAQTSDGGFIIAGYTLSFGAGGEDMYVVKTDSDGIAEWEETYGGAASDVAYSIQQTSDGGFILTGHTLSYGAGVHDVWLIRLGEIIPVELISFTADVVDNKVKLVWTTATEINNKGFEIERKAPPNLPEGEASGNSPFGGKEGGFVIIGYVEGNGTTSEEHSYSFIDNEQLSGKTKYRLKQIDYDGSYQYSNIVEVDIGEIKDFTLEQNYPNPFNPVTTINFVIPTSLPSEGAKGGLFVSLTIYDILGNEITTLINEVKQPGVYEVEFDASGLTSGIYFYRLQAGSFTKTKSMILMK